MDEPKLNNIVRLYPNPSQGHTTLSWKNNHEKAQKLIIYNTKGEVIRTRHFDSLESKATITLPELPKGMYILHLEFERYSNKIKWIVE